MKPKPIPSLVLVAASLVGAGSAFAGERVAPRQATHDQAQARLTVPQAATIAEVLGKGIVREVEWDPRSAAYEVKLATTDGQRREVRVEAYGGRLIEGASR